MTTKQALKKLQESTPQADPDVIKEQAKLIKLNEEYSQIQAAKAGPGGQRKKLIKTILNGEEISGKLEEALQSDNLETLSESYIEAIRLQAAKAKNAEEMAKNKILKSAREAAEPIAQKFNKIAEEFIETELEYRQLLKAVRTATGLSNPHTEGLALLSPLRAVNIDIWRQRTEQAGYNLGKRGK